MELWMSFYRSAYLKDEKKYIPSSFRIILDQASVFILASVCINGLFGFSLLPLPGRGGNGGG